MIPKSKELSRGVHRVVWLLFTAHCAFTAQAALGGWSLNNHYLKIDFRAAQGGELDICEFVC